MTPDPAPLWLLAQVAPALELLVAALLSLGLPFAIAVWVLALCGLVRLCRS